jgi:hypothetical protein
MKKYSMILFLIMISSIMLMFIRCTEEPMGIADINTSLPVITNIESSESRILIETAVQVSVTAQQGDSYSWSAEAGSFDAPTSSTTNWTASSTGGVYKLTCTVTNSSGSRNASVNIQVLEALLPDGVTILKKRLVIQKEKAELVFPLLLMPLLEMVLHFSMGGMMET